MYTIPNLVSKISSWFQSLKYNNIIFGTSFGLSSCNFVHIKMNTYGPHVIGIYFSMDKYFEKLN